MLAVRAGSVNECVSVRLPFVMVGVDEETTSGVVVLYHMLPFASSFVFHEMVASVVVAIAVMSLRTGAIVSGGVSERVVKKDCVEVDVLPVASVEPTMK